MVAHMAIPTYVRVPADVSGHLVYPSGALRERHHIAAYGRATGPLSISMSIKKPWVTMHNTAILYDLTRYM